MGAITRESYNKRLDEIEEEIYDNRRLAVYSIINSITAYEKSLRIQILFENENLRLNDGEMFYLLIHINRLCEREKQNS